MYRFEQGGATDADERMAALKCSELHTAGVPAPV